MLSVSSVLQEGSDVFVELGKMTSFTSEFWYSLIEKPVTKVLTEADLAEMHFEPLTKYKFYENDEWNVR